MKIIKRKLSELKAPDRNVRMHTNKQLTEFRRSVEMFGQIRPIVIDEHNVMLAGNGLYETLMMMGREEADCYVVEGLSEKEKKKLMLADNRIYTLGVDDTEAFDAILAEIQDTDIPGYDEDLLNTLLASVGEVDDILSGYGTFTEESTGRMKAAAERHEDEAPATSSAPPAEPHQEIRQERYTTCPKCGERIPL